MLGFFFFLVTAIANRTITEYYGENHKEKRP